MGLWAHIRGTMAELVPPQSAGDLRQAAGLMQGWYRARRARLVKKALKRWGRLEAVEPFWIH